MAELIQRTDDLNTGREKLNKAIQKVDYFQKQIDEIVVEGDSSVEAAQARVDAQGKSFPTLKARLDEKEIQFSSQLAQKIDEVIFDVSNSKMKFYADGILINSIDITEAGNANAVQRYIDSLIEDGLIEGASVMDGTVTPEKTSFIAGGKNIFNPETITLYRSLDISTGEVIESSSFYVSDFIKVDPATYYTFSYRNAPQNFQVIYYNADKEFVGQTSNNPFRASSETHYIRFEALMILNPKEIQLEKGQEHTKFEPYGYTLKGIRLKEIGDNEITAEKTDFIIKSKNIFNKETVNHGFDVDPNTGELRSKINYITSDFIPVEPFTVYHISKIDGTSVSFYNQNKEFISQLTLSSNVFTARIDSHFVRVSMKDTVSLDDLQIEKGDKFTGYEKYGYRIPYLILDGVQGGDSDRLKAPKRHLVWENTGNRVNTLARSYDGNLWGISNLRFFKSEDGGATFSETGVRVPDYYDLEKGEVAAMCVFSEDNILVGITDGRVLKFKGIQDTEPTEVLNTNGIMIRSLSFNFYSDGVNEYVFVGEYEHTNLPAKKLWASKDGGSTFFVLKEGDTDNPPDYGSGNNHWHSVAYDPFEGAIWACQGDGMNKTHYVTHDWGENWQSFGDGKHQPTLILPLPKRVVFGRDALTPGASEIIRNGTLEFVNKFSFREEYGADMFYPSYQPIVTKNINEAYINFVNQGTPDGMNYLYGTGDGGESWHLLYSGTARISELSGIDKHGYIFMRSSNYLYRAKMEWH